MGQHHGPVFFLPDQRLKQFRLGGCFNARVVQRLFLRRIQQLLNKPTPQGVNFSHLPVRPPDILIPGSHRQLKQRPVKPDAGIAQGLKPRRHRRRFFKLFNRANRRGDLCLRGEKIDEVPLLLHAACDRVIFSFICVSQHKGPAAVFFQDIIHQEPAGPSIAVLKGMYIIDKPVKHLGGKDNRLVCITSPLRFHQEKFP